MNCVYEIRCGNDNYIGSTENLKTRIRSHRHKCKISNTKLYQKLKNNEYTIDILEENIEPSLLKQYEKEYILALKPTLNMIYPVKDPNYNKKWNIENKEYYDNYHKIEMVCECGKIIKKFRYTRHIKSKYHIEHLKLIKTI